MKNLLFLCSLALALLSCSNNKKAKTSQNEPAVLTAGNITSDKQLNITILLDLSDRIEPTKYPIKPEHFERDIEIVNYFTEIFKIDMEQKGAFMANGKIKVIFSPRPDDDEINKIASELSIDLSNVKNTKEKKKIFDNVSSTFRTNLERIYAKTIETKNYPGSDIWRFFKNDVADYAISDDKDYRNILVVLTDGYLYHASSKDKDGNRSMYLLPIDIKKNGFRSSNWKEKFEEGDYGYISTRDNLDNLDVLVLEISPTPQNKDDEDIIKSYLKKWFREMNVNYYELYNSDLPQYTKTRIDKFIKNG
ncbi:hypothetical protein [Maribacter polysaccharolyticus]|uniref:hypothetical protein n=1 Tax=Maribacter polysaccharolyticus TaxID=3020831 RepID=UPI00237FAB99|nr:hypothetical protein [Maribacter polysaccharolyticus]MDE3742534.1 hypothetical protein [Maribacter polysaccharolyticus]